MYEPDQFRYVEVHSCGQCVTQSGTAKPVSERVSELEDKVDTLEKALVESEGELAVAEVRIQMLLEILNRAHAERVDQDKRLMPYRDQPLLPFGDLPG